MRSVTIIGVGRVGGALALALDRAGYSVKTLVTNHPDHTHQIASQISSSPSVLTPEELQQIDTDICIIATQDKKIRETAGLLSNLSLKKDGIAFHVSGSLASTELSPLSSKGISIGSVHPLVSIPDWNRGAKILGGAYFGVEGESRAVDEANRLVNALGGIPFEIAEGSKTLYHAAAVVACGHLTGLIETSQKMLLRCGISPEMSGKVLMPLVKSTVLNLSDLSPSEALTGPFARGDVETVERHLQVISEIDDMEIEAVYRILGEICIDLARQQGTNPANLDSIRDLILLDKSNSK